MTETLVAVVHLPPGHLPTGTQLDQILQAAAKRKGAVPVSRWVLTGLDRLADGERRLRYRCRAKKVAPQP
jgi:hypothetical protein